MIRKMGVQKGTVAIMAGCWVSETKKMSSML